MSLNFRKKKKMKNKERKKRWKPNQLPNEHQKSEKKDSVPERPCAATSKAKTLLLWPSSIFHFCKGIMEVLLLPPPWFIMHFKFLDLTSPD